MTDQTLRSAQHPEPIWDHYTEVSAKSIIEKYLGKRHYSNKEDLYLELERWGIFDRKPGYWHHWEFIRKLYTQWKLAEELNDPNRVYYNQ
jgi:hypothetical protein